MAKRYKSDLLASAHKTAQDLFDAGLMKRKTLDEYDEMCLEPEIELSPSEISAIRQRERVSKTSFALFLNVSTELVSKWEQGKAQPRGPALRLLTLVDRLGLETFSPSLEQNARQS